MTEHEKIQEIIRQKEQAPVALDPRRTALIIVDVQRFFTRPDSEFCSRVPAGLFSLWIGQKLPRNAQLPFYVFLIGSRSR